MACHWMKLADGTVVHVNMGRTRAKTCGFCKQRPVTLLCDSPVGTGTCDAEMCGPCSTRIGRDMDYCPRCEADRKAYIARTQGRLPFGSKPQTQEARS